MNLSDARTRLSHAIEQLRQGERITLCKRNQPIAQVTRVNPPSCGGMTLGVAAGQAVVPDDFDQTDDWLVDLFEGGDER